MRVSRFLLIAVAVPALTRIPAIGFDEGKKGHSNAPRVALVGNMKNLVKNGDQRDIVPTILTGMGVDVSTLQPKYKGAVLVK